MDNHDSLRDKLLQADGIDPAHTPGQDMDRFRQLLNRAGPVRPGRRNIMRNPFAKLSIAAAAVIVAALLALHFFNDTSSPLWANVLEQVMTFDTCVYRSRTVETTGPRPDGFEFATENESTNYRSTTYGAFGEHYENGKLAKRDYTLLQDQKYVALFIRGTDNNLCIRGSLKDEQIQAYHDSHPRSIVARVLTKTLDGDHTDLGQDTIDGKRVRGIQVDDPSVMAEGDHEMPPMDDFAATIWVDVETELPVWVEATILPKGSPVRMTLVWDRFEWGVPLEAGLFVPNITDDYEIMDTDGRSIADSTPKTEAAQAFANNTMAEPYLSDFDHLPLPDVSSLSLLGVDPTAPRPEIRLLGKDEVRTTQDATVAAWPKYDDVLPQLQAELQEKLDIDNMTANQLVTTGIALRERFWTLGGCLSGDSYPYGYASRLVIEKATELAPERTEIIDQLIESIISYNVMYTWDAEAKDVKQRNPIYTGLIADLRLRQYELLKRKLNDGYTLKWKDLVRCSDLILLRPKRQDFATALEVTQLLLDQMETGGWGYYEESLRRCEESLSEGNRSILITFMSPHDLVYARYGRRLHWFQGPPEYKQTLTPVHLRHIKDR